MKALEHIFILTNTLLKGGAEKQSLLLASTLSTHYKVTVVVYYGQQCDEALLQLTKEYQLNVLYLKGSHVGKCFQLFKLFRSHKNAAVFSYLATTNVLNAIIGSIAGVKLKIGGVRSDRIVPAKLRVQKFLHNTLLNATVFNNYAGQASLIQQGFAEKKCFVIHNCIALKAVRSVNNCTQSTFTIVSVGRFVPEKDITTGILAVKRLIEKLQQTNSEVDVKFLLIGYGPLELEIRGVIQKENLEDVVSVIINPSDMTFYLQSATVYLSTSLHEGLSNAILEAMECSLPVVATEVGDNKYLVKNNENGFLAPTKNIELLADHLQHLAMHPELCKQMGHRSYELLQQQFSVERFKEINLQLLQQLLERR